MSLGKKVTVIGGICLALTAIWTFSGLATGAIHEQYVSRFGKYPHPSVDDLGELKNKFDILAQYSQGEINSRQIGRQIEIDRLAAKCNIGRCTQYDLAVLQNLRAEWQREQDILNRLRQQQHQQQQFPR